MNVGVNVYMSKIPNKVVVGKHKTTPIVEPWKAFITPFETPQKSVKRKI